jgi:hypothetical protein
MTDTARKARRLRRLRAIANWTVPVYLGVLVVLSLVFGPYVYLPYAPLGEVILLAAFLVPLAVFLVVWLRFVGGHMKCPACDAPFPDPRERLSGPIPAECWFCHYNLVTGAPSKKQLQRTGHG